MRGPYDGFEDVALHGRWPEETARRKVAELGFTIPTETKPPRGVAARFLKPLQPARIMEHDSVADIDEGPLLEQLLASPFGLDSVLHMHAVMPADPDYRTCVELDSAPGSPAGDVDLLVWPKGIPSRAIAIEAKRIKVTEDSFWRGEPQKLRDVQKKAVQQANRLVAQGFWRVCLYILLAVDSRSQNPTGAGYKGLNDELRRSIEGTLSSLRLDARVGIWVQELVQSTDHSPTWQDLGGFEDWKPSQPTAQPEPLTEWIRGLPAKK